MTTDDAPRPALDAAEIAEGRRLLAAATPGPWAVTMDSDSWNDGAEYAEWVYGIAPILTADEWAEPQEANAGLIVWLRNHADALLAAAARAAALAREVERLRDQIERIQEDAERIESWGTALHADQDGSLTCILTHCRVALAPAAGEGAGEGR